MIVRPLTSPIDWKQELRGSLRSACDLADAGFILPEQVADYEALLTRFPMVLPRYYANLIDRNDPACPIRAQAIPRLEELDDSQALSGDPLQDLSHRPAPRITHRYKGRVLLHLTPNCSMNCRYCFRKSLLGENRAEFFEGEVAEALAYIASTPEVEEVIFSGGDPFLANEGTLSAVLERLKQTPHLKRVRFHSRVPVTLPMRVDRAFAQMLMSHDRPSAVVTHFNHPREITQQAAQALANLKQAGHTLLNQSVLLRGVNDNAETLAQLSEQLYNHGVLPYYLHHPDRAQGTKHFDLLKSEGIEIHQALLESLPGYLVPRYVVDNPAIPYKSSVES